MNVITYNIKNRSKIYPWKNRRDKILNKIKNGDIICLNEITPWQRVWLRKKLKKTHKFYGGWFGNAIFYNKSYELLTKEKVNYFKFKSLFKNIDFYRYFLRILIYIPDLGGVNVVCTHMGFGKEWEDNFKILKNTLEVMVFPSILCGDFNVEYGSDQYNKIIDLGYNDVNKNKATTFHGWRNDPSTEKIIDFVLTKNISKEGSICNSVNLLELLPSDHYPLCINFK